jgi:hypothetical protein
MEKIKIEAMPPDGSPPYVHLVPIVDALLENGNEIAGLSKFYMDRDGWRCDLRRPINFSLIEQRFDVPPSILLLRSQDGILCQYTWVSIHGNQPRISRLRAVPTDRP